MIITSKSNEKVKYIKSLNNKKDRQKNKAFYLEGLKVVSEVLEKKAVNVKFIAYSKILANNLQYKEHIESILNKNKHIEQIELSESVFKYVTDTVNPQGILCVVDMQTKNIDEFFYDKANFIILDKVQDPGNIGTILRSAVAFNVKNIICTEGTADIYSPKVLRSTMGTILNLNIYNMKDTEQNYIFEKLKQNEYKIVGTSLNATKSLKELDFGKYIFVVGNEANGVSNQILNMCDETIKIEMKNTVDSLNVGVATGILLYENYIKNK